MTKQKRKTSGKSRRKTSAASKADVPPRQRKPRIKTAPVEQAPIEQVPQIEVAALPSPPSALSRRRLSVVVGVVVGLGLLGWVASGTYLSKFTIGGTTTSTSISDAALERIVATHASQYRLAITSPDDQTKTYALANMGVTPDPAATVAQIRRAQRAPLHWLAWWRPIPARLQTKVDNQALTDFVAKQARIVITPAQDAHIEIESGNVLIKPEVPGKQYGFANPGGTLLTAIQQLQTGPLKMANTSLAPSITQASLAHTKTKLENILNQHVNIVIGIKVITPSPAEIGKWLTLQPNAGEVAVQVNQGQLQAYLEAVGAANATVPRSEVVSDLTGAVLVNGAPGMRVNDTNAAVTDVASHVLEAKGVKVSLPVSLAAFKTVTAPTAGKWIEVDTTTKRMYAYDQGEVVNTFLISSGASATPTVVGRFAIYAKYRSQDMAGGNADGSAYFQPDVPYVNYFYRDYAIHGNYWRPASYFGNVNSSHGCVGVQVDQGAWIYSWAPIGTPVIVHT